MDHHRLFKLLCVPQHLNQHPHVVTIDRPKVVKSKILEQVAVVEHLTQRSLGIGNDITKLSSDKRNLAHGFFNMLLNYIVAFRRPFCGQVTRKRTDAFGYRHIIVIENHNQVIAAASGIIESFINHPACKGSVPGDRDHMMRISC